MKYLKSLGGAMLFSIFVMLANFLTPMFIYIVFTALNNSNQMLQNQISMILAPILYIAFFSRYFKGNLFKMCNFKIIKIRYALIIILIAIFHLNIISFIIKAMDLYKYFPESLESHANVIQSIPRSFLMVAGIIIIPIVEEIVARGIIFNHLKKTFPLFAAVIIQALIFSIFHFNLLQGVVIFSTGIMIGLIYIKFKSILACIIAHFANNFGDLLSQYIIHDASFNSSILILIFSIIGFILCFIYIF